MAVRHAMQIKPLYYKGRVIETTLTWFKWVFEWRNIKICKMLLALSTLLMVAAGTCANVGWKSFLRENPTEFHDLPLTWEMKNGVPDWLSGTYVRNGPAQVRTRTCNLDWIWRNMPHDKQIPPPDQLWEREKTHEQLAGGICKASQFQTGRAKGLHKNQKIFLSGRNRCYTAAKCWTLQTM